MKVVYGEATAFKSLIEALSKLVDEALIKFTSDGMILKALDPARVSLISITIPPSAFEEYNVEEEGRFGFNTTNLLKIIKRAKKGEALEINILEDKVELVFRGTTTKRFRFLNLDVAEVEVPEASLEFKVHASLISDPLKNAIKDAETIGDAVEFQAENENELIIRGLGGESVTETRISRESGALISLSVEEPSKSSYAIEHLKAVLALTKVADTVEVQFSSGMPLKLDFNLSPEGKVEFLLAPKIE